MRTAENSLRSREAKEKREDGDLEKEKASVEAGSHVSHGAAAALSEQDGSAKTVHEDAPSFFSSSSRMEEDEEPAGAAAAAVAPAPPQEKEEGGKEKRVKVFMDFQQSRASWGVAHNRALESVLTQHPEAEVVVLVSAPGVKEIGRGLGGGKHVLHTAQSPIHCADFPPSLPLSLPLSELYRRYHYADALSRPHFQKYLKRGYNITIQTVNEKTFLAEGNEEGREGWRKGGREGEGGRVQMCVKQH